MFLLLYATIIIVDVINSGSLSRLELLEATCAI